MAKNAGKIHADPTKVRQILLNLLSNASKFTDRGSISLTVDRKTVDHRDWLQFDVGDTGIGVTAEQKKKLTRNSPEPMLPYPRSTVEPAWVWQSLVALLR